MADVPGQAAIIGSMSNLYAPWGDGQQDEHPTEQFWREPGTHPAESGPRGGGAGPVPGQPQPAALGEHLKNDRRKALHWTYAVAAVVLLAAGAGGLAALAGHPTPLSASGSRPAASSPGAAGPRATGPGAALRGEAGPSVQWAILSATLQAAGSPGPVGPATLSMPRVTRAGASAVGQVGPWCRRAHRAARAARIAGMPRLARAARVAAGRCFALRRLAFRFFLLRGVAGTFTVRARGGMRTLAFTRGVIESVTAGTSLVVTAGNGTTWTWHLVAATVVRDRAGKVPAGALTAGEPVWVGGPVRNGANDARLIVIRPPL